MLEVYLSLPAWKKVPTCPVRVSSGSLIQILTELESRYGLEGLKQAFVTSSDRVRSNACIYTNVYFVANRLYDSSSTRRMSEGKVIISESDGPILLSTFNPSSIVQELLSLLTKDEIGSSRIEHGGISRHYRAHLSSEKDHNEGIPLVVKSTPERIYGFTLGQPLSVLCTSDSSSTEGNTKGLFSKSLAQGIANVISDLSSASSTVISDIHSVRLRLFQQELAQGMVSRAMTFSSIHSGESRPLLLSVPTGGGKTEAFLFGLLAILERAKRQRDQATTKYTRAFVVYPTRALANDQAHRIAQVLYRVNTTLPANDHFSIGILTGDTPKTRENLQVADSPLQNCPRCQLPLTDFGVESTLECSTPLTTARCRCGAKVTFFRFTRQDILESPPDILITSPDMINRMLQSPKWRKCVFTPHLQTLVCDEAHVYGGAFGCHVAHMFRRVEEALGRQPLYVALSATIANARQLASLLFNAPPENVELLRSKTQNEKESSENRPYLDFASGPVRYRHHWAVAPAFHKSRYKSVVTATLNTVDALGHSIQDPHFRKTLIFSNSRQNTDSLVRLLRDHEERYFWPFTTIWSSLQNRATSSQLTEAELEIAASIGRWCEHYATNGTFYPAPLEFGWHRAGLEVVHRLRAVNRFMATQPLSAGIGDSPWPIDMMVATSTLELGIDIGDVTTAINCGAPRSVNEYVQRVGRAGRRKDSLALTVIDPTNPLDFHFLRNFDRFAHPTSEDFESVPLVISNVEITRRHLWARFLDFVAQESATSQNNVELTVGDLRRTTIDGAEGTLRLEDNPRDFARATFDCLFPEYMVNRWEDWLALEADCIEDSAELLLSREELLEWWTEKLVRVAKRLVNRYVPDGTLLTGTNPFDSDLVPSLRDMGTQVPVRINYEPNSHMYSGSNQDRVIDVVSRHVCVERYPQNAYVAMGTGSYYVDSANEDEEATVWVRRQFLSTNGDKAVRYFHRLFDSSQSPFPQSARDLLASLDVTLTVPGEVQVRPVPDRYHCSQCGSTYDSLPKHKGKPAPICIDCKGTLRQLTEIYSCGRCGHQKMPPIPKVCPNPACLESARSRRSGTRFLDDQYKFIGRTGKDAHYHNEFFRFDALPFLHWRCRSCGTVVNYHATYELSSTLQHQVLRGSFPSSSSPSSSQIAKFYLEFPESWQSQEYEAKGFARSWFECKACRSEGAYRKIHVINLPSSQSVLQEYWLFGKALALPREASGTHLLPFQVKRLALARERFLRYWSQARRQWKTIVEPIHNNPSYLLADGSECQAICLNFGDALSSLSIRSEFPLCCHSDRSCQCDENAAALQKKKRVSENSLEDGKHDDIQETESGGSEGDVNTKPRGRLTEWEFGRSPDPRRHWCDTVVGTKAISSENQKTCPGSNCANCQYFDERQMRRYLALHTLKHAILLAAPRFCGASRGQLRGVLNPNDENEFDLMIVDTIEGGSGAIMLLYRNWRTIWELAGELLKSALFDRSALLLPQGCSRFNCDLCPGLGLELWREVERLQV